METNQTKQMQTGNQVITITRLIDAPRELVYQACIDPKHLVHWHYASDDWTTPFAETDVRPGGSFRIGFASPDGKHDFVFEGVYRETREPEFLSYEIADGRPVSMMFEDVGGKTKLTLVLTLEPTHSEEQQREGWSAMLLHLGGYTESLAGSPLAAKAKSGIDIRSYVRQSGETDTQLAARSIVVSRVLDAPRELVYRAWTDPDHVVKWWGPKGFTNTNFEMDVRPGGIWRFIMHGPDGVDYGNKVKFHEVVKNERLVYLHGADDDKEQGRFLATVTFDEQDGKTKLTMNSIFATIEECEEVIKKHGALEGANTHLDCLAEYLLTMPR